MTPPNPRILIVDDNAASRKLLATFLHPEGYVTSMATNGAEALIMVVEQPPDLVLLDVSMPGLSGVEVARRLKADPATANIPIIMVSAEGDRAARLEGLLAGAEDYLTKPVDRGELWLRIRNLLRLKELSDALEDQRLILESQVQTRTADLQHLAHYDPMTGLPNRTLFYETLEKSLSLARDRGWQVAFLFIDVDDFKSINDSLGHAAGDALLGALSDRLIKSVRIRDTVGRLGGDEFGVILLLDNDQQGAALVAQNIQAAMRAPFDLTGHHTNVTVSIGISTFPTDAADSETLIKSADRAMYRAKQAGGDAYRSFTAELHSEGLAKLSLQEALRSAVDNDEFVLHYQPKVRLDSGRIAGVEALLRWERPGFGLVMPDVFIPCLEETGLIARVGAWVIAEACRQIGEWSRSTIGRVQVSVNVSARQFVDGDLEGDVSRALRANDVDGDLLELELTESSLMANTDLTIATLRQLRTRGVKISIDDFGTGYSSLAYLRWFPIDKLKIDIAFIRDITSSPSNASIAVTIIRMAHELKLDVIAEGVETPAQLECLRSRGCDEMQGYLASRPLPAPALEELIGGGLRLLPEGLAGVPLNTLLLVDSDPLSLAELQGLLRPDGYRILSAGTAEDAFELIATHGVQVVLCGHQLPGMNGKEFLERVKDLHPDALRILVSGETDHLNALIGAINSGAIQRYYVKPWEGSVLRNNIRDAFRQYRHSDDARRNEPATHRARALPALVGPGPRQPA